MFNVGWSLFLQKAMRIGNAGSRLINFFMPRAAVNSHPMIGVRCAQDTEDANNARTMSLAQSTHALADASSCRPTAMSHGRWKHLMADVCTPWKMIPIVVQQRLPKMNIS